MFAFMSVEIEGNEHAKISRLSKKGKSAEAMRS